MIRRVERVKGINWCGPTMLASVAGIPYEEADWTFRRVKNQWKRRVTNVSTNHVRSALEHYARKRGVRRKALAINLCNADFSPLTAKTRPRIENTKALNQIARNFPDYVPVAIVCGPKHDKFRHVIAYDHRRKRLCDNHSYGRVVALKDHPLKRYYVFRIMMVPKEFYDGRN